MIKVGKGLVKNNIGGACNERYMDPIMKLIIIYIRRKKEKKKDHIYQIICIQEWILKTSEPK